MFRAWRKYLAAAASALSAVAAIVLTVSALGGAQAAWALVAGVAASAVGSLVVLLISGRETISTYRQGATDAQSGLQPSSPPAAQLASDPDFLYRQVVPAFLDTGLDRTRKAFLDLVDHLDVSSEDREEERRFIDETYDDETLSPREKVSRIVSHFAPGQPNPPDGHAAQA